MSYKFTAEDEKLCKEAGEDLSKYYPKWKLPSFLIYGKPLIWFTNVMAIKLKLNSDRPHWRKCTIDYLFKKLVSEVYELSDEIERYPDHAQKHSPTPAEIGTLNAIIKEAADVANYAMMIADVANGLKNGGMVKWGFEGFQQWHDPEITDDILNGDYFKEPSP
jgi:NTP pyrophosphatase (non-canonical NTP hydrolase)